MLSSFYVEQAVNIQESPGVLTYLYLECENDIYELEPSYDH